MKVPAVILTAALLLILPVSVGASMADNIFATRQAITRITGRKITDFWAMEYNERISQNGAILMTKGAVELNGDGVKRLFWCHFDVKTMQLLRLKIDSKVLFTLLGS